MLVIEGDRILQKRGFGVGWWNGFGGKINHDETIEEAAKRYSSEGPAQYSISSRYSYIIYNKFLLKIKHSFQLIINARIVEMKYLFIHC